MIQSVDPMTGEVLERFEAYDERACDAVLNAASHAQRSWGRASHAERAEALRALAAELRKASDEGALLMATEMGKPVREGRAEMEKCAWCCDFYAEHAEGFLADAEVATDAGRSFVRHLPIGVVLAVMPWNFPFWQVLRCAVAALAAGDAVVVKHASNVPRCALAIEDLARRAGLPPDLIRVVLVEGPSTGRLIADRRVAMVSLTGSEQTGRIVAAQAGQALKKVVLELGGSDPFVVLGDADVAATARAAAAARTVNSGQSCIAAKRFLVAEEVAEPFLEAFAEAMSDLVVDDPRRDSTEVGPLARRDLRDHLHGQVERSLLAGARLVLGGQVPEGPGAFYPPSILAEVGSGSPAATEELFGPVAAVTSFSSEDELVSLANASPYGLGASVWTADPERGERLGRVIETGMVFVNGMVKSDPRLPFGGVKDSGHGRELGGRYGLLELVNTQTVWVAGSRA
jgi:succinate-semialdehyde dehydrogenase/glutarate-semialdehyde dehydrogenase